MPVWGRLAHTTPIVSPNTISNASTNSPILGLELQYWAGTKTMGFYGSVMSKHGHGRYNMQIVFLDVDAKDGLTEQEIQEGYYPKPDLSRNEIQVRCSCTNYRFRFDKANRMNDAGTGSNFPFYHRKTNRKPNNPRNLPGFCGHLLTFIEYLQRNGFITG